MTHPLRPHLRRRLLVLAPLAAGLIASPVLAAAPFQSAQLIDGTLADRHHAPTLHTRRLADMDLRPRGALQRPYDQLGANVRPDILPTQVSYQLAPKGPVGSVGLVHMESFDRSVLSNEVQAQSGPPRSTVGAAVSYQFK